MNPMRPEPTAAEAIRLMLNDDIEAGLALYRRVLRVEDLPDSPVGIHLVFLRNAGKIEAEDRLLELALERGADIAVKAGGLGAEPGEAASEYEALIARGLANSRMVYQYLRVLAELARWDDLHQMFGRGTLLRQVLLDHSASSTGGSSAAVAALIRKMESRAEHQEAVQSVRRMRMLKEFATLEHPAAKALMLAISIEVRRYLADWRSANHPLARLVPQDIEIDAWCLISHTVGYTVPHIHPRAWATGVFYPVELEAGSGGDLVIGRPEGAAGSDEDWETTRVRPQSGLLVLMPSYFTHWTERLLQPGLRMSVAFDVCRT